MEGGDLRRFSDVGFSSNVVGNHHFQSDQFQSTLFIRLKPIPAQNRVGTLDSILKARFSLSLSLLTFNLGWRICRSRHFENITGGSNSSSWSLFWNSCHLLQPPSSCLSVCGFIYHAVKRPWLSPPAGQTNNVWNRNPFKLETAACTRRP